MRCDTNPAAGRELTHGEHLLTRAEHAEHVVVVGGGPAGLKVAETAARRGHRVVLHEATQRLGGQLVAAGRQPRHAEGFEVAAHLIREVERLGVAVRLGSRVAEAALLGAAVVLAGNGHWEAAGTAEYLADLGADVTVVTTASLVGAGLEGTNQELFHQRANQKGIAMRTRARAVEIGPDTVVVEALDTGERSTITGVTCVVPVLGRRSVEQDYLRLRRDGRFAGRLHRVGDCVAPRLLRAVVAEAYETGAQL